MRQAFSENMISEVEQCDPRKLLLSPHYSVTMIIIGEKEFRHQNFIFKKLALAKAILKIRNVLETCNCDKHVTNL